MSEFKEEEKKEAPLASNPDAVAAGQLLKKRWQRDATILATVKGMGFKGGLGGIAGYAAGNFAKQVSNMAILYGGVILTFIGAFAYAEWITIEWNNILDDIKMSLGYLADAQGKFMTRVKNFMTTTLPLAGGFSASFYYAFKNT